jgi:hypothetical protein
MTLTFCFTFVCTSLFVVHVGITVYLRLVENFVSSEIMFLYARASIVFRTLPETSFTLTSFVVDKIINGKRNTAHCVRFPGEWYDTVCDYYFPFILCCNN